MEAGRPSSPLARLASVLADVVAQLSTVLRWQHLPPVLILLLAAMEAESLHGALILLVQMVMQNRLPPAPN